MEGGKYNLSWISIGSVLFSRSNASSWRQKLNLRCPKLFDQWVYRHLNWLHRIGGYSSPPTPHNSSFLHLVFLWTILGLHCCKQIKDYFVALLFSNFDWSFIFFTRNFGCTNKLLMCPFKNTGVYFFVFYLVIPVFDVVA